MIMLDDPNRAVDSMDYTTRMRMREQTKTVGLFVLLFGIATFILGMVIGSALHDLFFHALEG